MGALPAPAADGLPDLAGGAVAEVAAAAGGGAAEVGAAALVPGAAAPFSAGFGLGLATGAATGAALELLAGVCALAADANEIIPATADIQKALLRRITTLSKEIEYPAAAAFRPRHQVSSVD